MRQAPVYANLSPAERLGQINLYLQQPVQWQPLSGQGTTNRLFRHPEADQVLRLNLDGLASFGVDRHREAAVLERIQGTPWAPEVLHNAPDQGWLLMAWYQPPQHQPSANDWLSTLQRWQACDPVPALDYAGLLQAYRQALPDNDDASALMQALDNTLAALPDQRHGLVHHDLHPGNLLADAQGWRVIDWEYAGWGCPWLDIAAVQQYWGLTQQQVAQLPLAQGHSEQSLAQVLDTAAQFNALLNLAWYWVRSLEDGPD